MSENESHHHGKHEIIIIKRHGGGHEGAHGGAWKIAYADFMTAMMAFFLIMWLVNAANEETKAAVASYFNPIKLTDSRPAPRGLEKPAKDAEGENQQSKSKDEGEEKSPGSSADNGKDKSAQAGKEVKYSEADYFENPYSVLAEIAKDNNTQANISAKGEGGAQDTGPANGADGGDAYRDPFDPDFWTQQVEVATTTSSDAAQPNGVGLPDDGTSEKTTGEKSDTTGKEKEGELKAGTQKEGDLKAREGLTENDGMTDAKSDKNGTSEKDKNGTSDKDKLGKDDKDKNGKTDQDKNGKDKDDGLTPMQQQAAKLQAELRKQLGDKAGDLANGLTVTATDEGLLVSITDRVKTPMFDVGSSVPKKETVLAMTKVALAIKDQKGSLIIRGHTDGRPFKKGEYDNWRLSTARAQSAYFMLVNAGFPEARIAEVAGLADRQLKIPGEPLNDQNRRIEILVKMDKG